MNEVHATSHMRGRGADDDPDGGLADLRAREFGFLDEGGHTYLDHTGAALPPRSLVTGSAQRITGGLFGNPHSESPASRASGHLLAEARRAVLRHFDADPAEYAVIFTANATGALRLVGEAYPFTRGTRLVMSLDNHNSVNGLREYARARGATTTYVPVSGSGLQMDGRRLRGALSAPGRRFGAPLRGRDAGRSRGLLAYPAQSNFTGVQHPLEWIAGAQAHGYDVLLDAAGGWASGCVQCCACRRHATTAPGRRGGARPPPVLVAGYARTRSSCPGTPAPGEPSPLPLRAGSRCP